MKIKFSLLFSAFLTAAILTVVGGILTLTGNEKKAYSNAATETSAAQLTQVAEYQSLLGQAQQQNSTPTATGYSILPDQAAAIATRASGEIIQKTPKLVNYNGTAAYEVVFPSGNVYIDANSGAVLYNGVKLAETITSEKAIQIAEKYTGNTNVTGIDTGVYNGAPAYRVIFKNGEEIYIDVHGTVLAVQLPSSVQSESTKTNDNE